MNLSRGRSFALGASSIVPWAYILLVPCILGAQEPVHLNPVIAKLEAGETVYGLSPQDLSLSYARQVARAPADFVYVDMEHSPMDFPALSMFLLLTGDKQSILRKGNPQPNVALFARFAPPPLESEWVVKQALDMGFYGVIFNGVDTPEEAACAVSTMRYPQLRGSPYPEPAGIRGSSVGNAAWAWGVGSADAFQQILAASQRHDVACAISANTGEDVARRVREGWRIIRTSVEATNEGRAILEAGL